MRRFFALAFVLLGTVSLAGCRDGCTSEVRYGVEVLILEPGGPYDAPVTIRYRVDGSEWYAIDDTTTEGVSLEADCTARGRCLLGAELDGFYEVEVRRDIARARFETIVSANACHVQTVTVPLSLPAT